MRPHPGAVLIVDEVAQRTLPVGHAVARVIDAGEAGAAARGDVGTGTTDGRDGGEKQKQDRQAPAAVENHSRSLVGARLMPVEGLGGGVKAKRPPNWERR